MAAPAACRAARQAGYVPTTPLAGGGSRRASFCVPPHPRRQRNGTSNANYTPGRPSRLLIAASAAAAATSTSVARPRSADVLGVVILDAGQRSSAADNLLLSVASMYGRVTRREVVAVANTATLEAAVRGCMEDGATKVMIVPYCVSHSVQPDTHPALALADVQGRLPGIRCMMGDTIAMDELLVEFIEGQVRIVEGRRAAVPERCGEQLQQPASQAAPSGDSLHTSSGVPPREPQWQSSSSSSSSSSGADASEQQAVWSDTFSSAQEPAAGSSAGPSSSSGAAGRGAWSDDMATVLVVDYRECSESAAGGSAGGNAAPIEPAGGLRSGIVGSSFDMGDAAGASSGEDDWSSHLSYLSGCSGTRGETDTDGEGSGGNGGGIAVANSDGISEGHHHSSAAAGQPLYDDALERRLSRMEEQLQHIATLLEGQAPAQQAQQAQQPPSWQSAMFEPQAAELVESEVEATLYSPQQLAFLARKRAAKRARAGRP